jgi:hypothetical protein
MKSLEMLFTRFNHFCYCVNYGFEIPRYFGEDIRKEIFKYRPSEALPFIRNAIHRLGTIKSNIPVILVDRDLDQLYENLNGEAYSLRARALSLEEAVQMALIATLEEIERTFGEIKLELEKSLPATSTEIL